MVRSTGFRAASALVVAVVLALACSPALAAPVVYDESVSGDLSATSGLTVFNFDYGLNSVSGTTTGPTTDFDSFAFTIPPGHQLTTGSLVAIGSSGSLATASWNFRSGGLTWNSGSIVEFIQADIPEVVPFTTLPQGPGNYTLSVFGLSGTGSANYQFAFTVIPEPASLSLLAVGSLALLARRRVGG